MERFDRIDFHAGSIFNKNPHILDEKCSLTPSSSCHVSLEEPHVARVLNLVENETG